MSSKMEFIGRNLIPTVAYGDSAGLPFETMSRERIMEKYRKGVLRLQRDKGGYARTSDDTELTVVMAESLIEAGGFDLEVVAAGHCRAHEQLPQISRRPGKYVAELWGSSTDEACKRLRNGVSPTESGVDGTAGNGILMKMAPLVYWQVARPQSDMANDRELDLLTSMTHNSDVARATTKLHAEVLRYLLQNPYDRQSVLDVMEQSMQEMDDATRTEIQNRIKYLWEKDVSATTIMRNSDKRGFYAPETIGMAYGAFFATERSRRLGATVYRAVNFGGDTDSIASIAATLKLFSSTEADLVFPRDFNLVRDHEKLSELSRCFARRALRLDSLISE